jgi:hypothetical protein
VREHSIGVCRGPWCRQLACLCRILANCPQENKAHFWQAGLVWRLIPSLLTPFSLDRGCRIILEEARDNFGLVFSQRLLTSQTIDSNLAPKDLARYAKATAAANNCTIKPRVTPSVIQPKHHAIGTATSSIRQLRGKNDNDVEALSSVMASIPEIILRVQFTLFCQARPKTARRESQANSDVSTQRKQGSLLAALAKVRRPPGQHDTNNCFSAARAWLIGSAIDAKFVLKTSFESGAADVVTNRRATFIDGPT